MTKTNDQEVEPQTNREYRPASGPAYAQALNMDQYEQMKAQARLDFGDLEYAKHGGGDDAPIEQRDIESAVFAGANAHKPDVSLFCLLVVLKRKYLL